MAGTRRRKLLTAAVGVATVSYVIACGGVGDGGDGISSGNLVAPPGGFPELNDGRGASGGAGGSSGSFFGAAGAAGVSGSATSGNLVAPPPPVPEVDAGLLDAAVPSADGAAADAAPVAEDAAVDSGP